MTNKNNLDEMINAIRIEDYEKVNEMIDNGYVFSENGEELQYLTCNDNFDSSLVEKMIKNGAKVDGESNCGFTPLFNISYVSRKEIAEILIKNGADVNHKTHLGSTCLMNCVSGSDFNFDYFVYLIENGATIKDKDTDEETIVDYAIRSNKSEKIINTLKKIYDENYDIENIKKICLDEDFIIYKSDIDKIKEEFAVWKYSFKNSEFKRSYYEVINSLSNVDRIKINDINKLLRNEEYFEAYRVWNSIMSETSNRSNIYLYFILLDILIKINLKDESEITINAIDKMLTINNIKEKYSSKLYEYRDKISKINKEIDNNLGINTEENLKQKSFEKEKYIIPNECYLSVQKKIKDFFESMNAIQREAINDSNIKIKKAIKLSLQQYNNENYMKLIENNNDDNYVIDSSNIELVVEGCKACIDILENDIKTATTLIKLIYPESITIIYQNPDIVLDVSKSKLYCFIIEELTNYILNSNNNKLINFYKEEVIPIVITYFLREECIERIYATFLVTEIEKFKENKQIEQLDEDDDYIIINYNDEDFSKIRGMSGYIAGDFSLMLNAFEKKDCENIYIIKKDNILIGNFALNFEENIINLYVFFTNDIKENIINHMKYLIKYIRKNYDFDKCQIRMTDAGPGGKEMFMLDIFNKIEDLSVHNKFGISVWWYGFSKE